MADKNTGKHCAAANMPIMVRGGMHTRESLLQLAASVSSATPAGSQSAAAGSSQQPGELSHGTRRGNTRGGRGAGVPEATVAIGEDVEAEVTASVVMPIRSPLVMPIRGKGGL